MRVELTPHGSVKLTGQAAQTAATADSTLVRITADAITLTLLPPTAVGGLILKRTSTTGDRAVLVIEHIRDRDWAPGHRDAQYDAHTRTLTIPLQPEHAQTAGAPDP